MVLSRAVVQVVGVVDASGGVVVVMVIMVQVVVVASSMQAVIAVVLIAITHDHCSSSSPSSSSPSSLCCHGIGHRCPIIVVFVELAWTRCHCRVMRCHRHRCHRCSCHGHRRRHAGAGGACCHVDGGSGIVVGGRTMWCRETRLHRSGMDTPPSWWWVVQVVVVVAASSWS